MRVPAVEFRQRARVKPARVAIRAFPRVVGLVQNLVARLAAFILAAQFYVKDPGGNQFVHAERFARIFPMPQRVQIRGQLQLHAVFHQNRIHFLPPDL